MRSIKRRRQEGRTDYKARLALLKSSKPRLVIRKTNRYIIAQIVESDIAQDRILIGTDSKVLLTKGWSKEKSGSLKSLPAAYLTGLLLGNLAKGKVKEAILDMGMHRNVSKSRIYAALKGALDSGLDIPHSSDSLPSFDNIKPEIKKIFDKIKSELGAK